MGKYLSGGSGSIPGSGGSGPLLPGPFTINVTTGSGNFGTIAVETGGGFEVMFEGTFLFLLGVYVRYSGASDAFRLDGIIANSHIIPCNQMLIDGLQIPFCVPPENRGTDSGFYITALAADPGVLKTGTLTFYDTIYDVPYSLSLNRVVKDVTLTKTYVP